VAGVGDLVGSESNNSPHTPFPLLLGYGGETGGAPYKMIRQNINLIVK